MKYLSIDIETYSSKDLTKCGVYSYVQAIDFEVLLFGYAFDDEEVRVLDLKNGELLPIEVKEALTNPDIIKTAFNANFERTCLMAHFNMNLPIQQWRCTAVHALTLGLPFSLEAVSRALRISKGKLKEGKSLVKYFSSPRKAVGSKEKSISQQDMEKWELFKSYCKRDVEVEREVRDALEKYKIPDQEQRIWFLDQEINDRGIMVDTELINHALACDKQYNERLLQSSEGLAATINPRSAAQLKKILLEEEGLEIDSLSKETVEKLIASVSSAEVKKALELRQELSKTSIKKYEAMSRAKCMDNRIRGLLQFYGANRTGRWAGRLVQVQNLPQNKIKDIDAARDLLKAGQYETLELLFPSVPEVLSQLIRTAFVPSKDSRFIIADFSAIEARVIAWLADEKWRMEVFSSHGRIYEASAAQMFKVPIEKITKGSSLRQKGKIAELALGYQGSKGALLAMGALKMGLEEEELLEIVSAWRKANMNIVRLWSTVEKAAVSAITNERSVSIHQSIEFSFQGGILFIRLPSGRKLSYISPRLEIDKKYGKQIITYEGIDQGNKQWVRLSTYGGKLTENIVQAIARDCLAEAMLRLDKAGYKIVMHIHDEVVLDVPVGFGALSEVEKIMSASIPWAKGLPLRADVFESCYYRKD